MPTNLDDTQNSLSTADILEFDRRRTSARTRFAGGVNNLALQRSRAETDFGRTQSGESIGGGAFGRLGKTFSRRRSTLPGSFVGRGLINSGIFRDTLNRHFTDKSDAISDLEIEFTRAFQDFDTSEEGLGQALEGTLAQIEGDQQLRRSLYAELIRSGGSA